MVRLSIVTTMYKTAAYLPKCIDSLLDQDIPLEEYEIILVNDGSPDRDLEVAQEYAAKYPNIKVISHENKGLAGARNTGLDVAQGKYITFVDPDDYILSKSLSSFLSYMDLENLDMLRLNYQMIDEAYNEIERPKDARLIDYSSGIVDGKEFLIRRLGYACFVWTFIYRLSLIKDNAIRFTQGIYFDDTDWLPRVLYRAHRVDTIDCKRYFYLQRSGSLVKTADVASQIAKYSGQMAIIRILSRRCESLDDFEVLGWYRRMISKLVLALLDGASKMEKQVCRKYIHECRLLGLFPLSQLGTTKPAQIKVMICNFSPVLYCWLIRRRG